MTKTKQEISKEDFFSKTILSKANVLQYLKEHRNKAIHYTKLMSIFNYKKSVIYTILRQLIIEGEILSHRGFYIYNERGQSLNKDGEK